ncbi:MAG TPA: hypothetical protein VGI45_17000 [Terracidiphilus sp.]|jgi:hypothetical protein
MSLEKIIAQLKQERSCIDEAIQALTKAVGTAKNGGTSRGGKKRKARVLSADARKRIADGQRRRWAAQKAKK